jgi:hypothetical protein
MRGKEIHRRRICFALILLAIVSVAGAGPRDDLWKQVNEATGLGLVRTAISILEEIIPQAIEDGAYPEALKALAMKVNWEAHIEGDKAEEKIVRLEAEMAELPDPMMSVTETILAHWYWQYFQQNRWRFVDRTQTAEPPGEDITTWDLPRILAEIDLHFTLALEAEEELKAIPIAEYDDLLERGTVPDSYRPTLYDFIAHEALSFYNAGEQAGAASMDAFKIMADSLIFAPVDEFLTWQPETTDTDSPKLKAIGLYQDLLAFHQNDTDQTAFIDADLLRLTFGYNHALGPEKNGLYMAALERFVDHWDRHEITSRALYEWARVARSQGDLLLAHELASRAWTAYQASVGGIWSYNLIQQIEAKSATIKTERVWNDPLADIEVTYRNVDRVFFRAVPFATEDAIQPRWRSWVEEDELQVLLKTRPALEWSADLPATTDFQQRTEKIPAPAGLDKGFHFIIASHDPSFGSSDNQLSFARVWISDLALVMRSLGREGSIGGFVLDARSGDPLAGATVTLWEWDHDSRRYQPDAQTSSDENGLFKFTRFNSGGGFTFIAEHNGQELASNSTYVPNYHPVASRAQTVLFTDRSLYRPGQTIHYKGICIRTDPAADNYQTLVGRGLIIAFRDTNGQEIATREVRTNDYGSFSGSFTAPRDRLMGRMSIAVQWGPSGSAYINVEEYKRPKFRVQVEAPAEAPRLDAEVVVPGKATAYTGAAIGGAEISWSVVRQVRFPIWSWWARWRYPSYGTEQIIAHGQAVTEVDGSFSINFTAKPDLSILPEDEPVFSYRIHADVTDTTGETRSAERVVRAGYTALEAAIFADAWQIPDRPVELVVTTQSLDGQPEAAAGTVRLFTLRQPAKVIRAGLGSTGPQPDPSDPNSWEQADLIGEHSFQTDAQGLAVLSMPLGAGIYRAILETQDRFGESVSALHTIHVLDPQAEHFDVRVPNHFAAPTWSLEPGEVFTALWGTGYRTGRAYVELECRGQLLRAWWTDPNRTQEVIEQEVTEDMRGGFTLRVTYVRQNRAYVNQRIVDVPWSNKQLTVRWERFRSLLEPGHEEVWTAIITGSDATAGVAEMVAGMYDASLDQFLPHSWVASFGGFRRESLRVGSRFENNSLLFSTVVHGWSVDYMSATLSYRRFDSDIVYLTQYHGGVSYGRGGGAAPPMGRGGGDATAGQSADAETPDKSQDDPVDTASGPDLDQVSVRQNLDETAFFFPHLLSDPSGAVRIEFTIPEALTEWRFLGFAHDSNMRSGFLTGTTVTAKDLMVQPNPPRFVREGDTIEFTVKVSNQSAARQTGNVSLLLADARTLESRDVDLGNLVPEQVFDVPSMESRTYSWRLTVPDDCDFLTYKAVGATTRLSDGEEGYLPVLSRRILVTESLPLPVRGAQTKEFEFTKLLESGQSPTLRHQSLTVQMVSQPAWYAVMLSHRQC